jgi:hypothetical protein
MIASTAVPWPALVQQFPNHHRVLFFELTCSCGDWRSAISLHCEWVRLACPRCGELHRPFVLGKGTRANQCSLGYGQSIIALCRSRTGRPKAREVTARVLRTVSLMVQGKTAPETARELNLSSSHYNLFVRRRKTDIDAELRRITINS